MIPVIQEHNLTTEKSLKYLDAFLTENMAFYGLARVRLAAVPSQKNPEVLLNGICTIRVFPNGENPPRREDMRFKQVHLLEEWISPNKISELISQAANGKLTVARETVLVSEHFKMNYRGFFGAPNPYSNLPGWHFQGDASTSSLFFSYEQLVKPPLPHYANVETAIAEWAELKPFHGNSDGRRGGLLIFLPELRAYFKNVTFEDRTLRLIVHRERQLKQKVSISGTWFHGQSRLEEITREAGDEAIELKAPKDATSFQIFLADKNEGIYDYRQDFDKERMVGPETLFEPDLLQYEDLEDIFTTKAGRKLNRTQSPVSGAVELEKSEEPSSLVAADGPDESSAAKIDPRKVFIVHGRNTDLRQELEHFIRTVGLQPIEWAEAIAMTKKPNPYVGDIIEKVFANAKALIVLMTPDDEVRLKREFWAKGDGPAETQVQGQSRPNVIFEAGMALGQYEKNTILIEIGNPKPFSDKAGRHVLKMDDTPEKRYELVEKLRIAGCDVRLDGISWLRAGKFSPSQVSTQAGWLRVVSKLFRFE